MSGHICKVQGDETPWFFQAHYATLPCLKFCGSIKCSVLRASGKDLHPHDGVFFFFFLTTEIIIWGSYSDDGSHRGSALQRRAVSNRDCL